MLGVVRVWACSSAGGGAPGLPRCPGFEPRRSRSHPASLWLRPAPRPGTRSHKIHEAPACVLSTWHCILSALPCVGSGLGHILAGLLADFLLQRRVLGTAPIRKLFSALNKDKPSSATQPFQHACVACYKTLPISSQGMLLPAALLGAVPHLGCSPTLVVALLTLALTIISVTGAGFGINHMDVAPRYAGFLLGITNTFGIVAGIIVPTAAGLLISQDPQSGWSNSFLLSAALNLFGLIFHTAFGSRTGRGRTLLWSESHGLGKGHGGTGSTFSHLCPAPDPSLLPLAVP